MSSYILLASGYYTAAVVIKLSLFNEITSVKPLDLAVACVFKSEKKLISPKYSSTYNSLI
jgi:hypothetical protein